jgi:phage terminase large subunit-like protein
VVRHRGDPVLAWAIGNVVMESDANANIKPNKKSSNKIDPAVSALMAFGTFQAEHEDFAFDMSDTTNNDWRHLTVSDRRLFMREANHEVMTTIRLGGNLVSFSEKYTIGLFEPQGRP